MRRRPLTTVAVLAAVAALAVGCGDDTDAPASSDGSAAASTAGVTGSGDDGQDAVDAGPAEAPRFCDVVTAEQISEVVGAPVTTEVGPFDACEFAQEDLRALSGMLGSTPVESGSGGFEAYRTGAKASLTDGVDHPIDGLGDEAFVATGTIGGGEALQAGGAVDVGGVAYTVNLSGTPDTSEDDIVRIAEGLLKLMVDAAS